MSWPITCSAARVAFAATTTYSQLPEAFQAVPGTATVVCELLWVTSACCPAEELQRRRWLRRGLRVTCWAPQARRRHTLGNTASLKALNVPLA
jgi:hypothetical protein